MRLTYSTGKIQNDIHQTILLRISDDPTKGADMDNHIQTLCLKQ